MIQIADNLEYEESRKVPLNPRFKRVLIEVASNRNIDLAVVDAEEEKAFEGSPTGHEPEIDWVENVRNWDLEFEFPQKNSKYYLLFWNSNEKNNAVVAYKITPIE